LHSNSKPTGEQHSLHFLPWDRQQKRIQYYETNVLNVESSNHDLELWIRLVAFSERGRIEHMKGFGWLPARVSALYRSRVRNSDPPDKTIDNFKRRSNLFTFVIHRPRYIQSGCDVGNHIPYVCFPKVSSWANPDPAVASQLLVI
jgi:hypothetical protein